MTSIARPALRRSYYPFLIAALIAIIPLFAWWQRPASVRIMPLGDSITQGKHHVTYRYVLWKQLVDAGVNFDFVGSQNSTEDGQDPGWANYKGHTFDPDHEGHWGWKTGFFLQPQTLPLWANTYKPDVVLLHLGTNDALRQYPKGETVIKLKSIIAILRQANPRVTVLMAKLIGTIKPENSRIQELNNQMDAIAASTTTNESPIIVVDQMTGFDPQVGADTYDGLHPNARGEQKMAEQWFRAIRKTLKWQDKP